MSVKGTLRSKYCFAVLAAFCIALLPSSPVYADTFATGDSLTNIFTTRGFMGNAEVLTKLNWVSGLVSNIISISCFIGLALTCIRIMFSLLYLSARNLFDTVHELKSSNSGSFGKMSGVLGPLLGPSIAGYGKAGGLDVFLHFILGLLPDIKTYSDFNEEKGLPGKLKPEDGVTEYILKISLSTIMSIFFFSIGWNGVLWQAYGSIVDAMGVAAERMVNDDFSTAVENALGTGKSYRFGFDLGNTKQGAFQQSLAKSMYNNALKKLAPNSKGQDKLLALGKLVENKVASMDPGTLMQVAMANEGGSSSTGKVPYKSDAKALAKSGAKWEKPAFADKLTTSTYKHIFSETNPLSVKDGSTTKKYHSAGYYVAADKTYVVYNKLKYDEKKADTYFKADNFIGYAVYDSKGSLSDVSDDNWANLAHSVVVRSNDPSASYDVNGGIDSRTNAYVTWMCLEDETADLGQTFTFRTKSANAKNYLLVMIYRKNTAGTVNYFESINNRTYQEDDES